MNILSKKRWHVKNKDNADRVEKDEYEFRQKKKSDNIRSLVATQEARANYLRRKTKGATNSEVSSISAEQTLRLFAEVEENRDLYATNKDYEDEKKEEREKQEKHVGILKYLGESSDGKLPEKPWWADAPPRKKQRNDLQLELISEEVDANKKHKSDPLYAMKKVEDEFTRIRELKLTKERKERTSAAQCVSKYPSFFPDDIKTPLSLQCESIQPSIAEKAAKLEKMRAERLARERAERERAAVIISKSMGLSLPEVKETEVIVDERRLPFNSIFNPELATAAAERRFAYRQSKKRR